MISFWCRHVDSVLLWWSCWLRYKSMTRSSSKASSRRDSTFTPVRRGKSTISPSGEWNLLDYDHCCMLLNCVLRCSLLLWLSSSLSLSFVFVKRAVESSTNAFLIDQLKFVSQLESASWESPSVSDVYTVCERRSELNLGVQPAGFTVVKSYRPTDDYKEFLRVRVALLWLSSDTLW